MNIRELRNRGGDVIDRIVAGERLVVTRGGRPVAELHPVGGPALTAEALLARWNRLPPVDAGSLRADLEGVLDTRL